MPKINVLHILSTLQFGGAEKQVVTLLNEINKKKFSVFLCCLHAGGPLEENLEKSDISLIFIRLRLRYCFITLYKLVKFMRNNNIQIVHTHLYTGHVIGRLAAFIAGVPVIITTEHGRGVWKKKRHLILERFANRFTDMRIAVSEDVYQIRAQREKTPYRKLIIIRNAVNPDEFDISDNVRNSKRMELGIGEEEIVIGTIARFDPDKALDTLMDSFAIMLDSNVKIRLLIVGDGNLRNDLMNYSKQLRLNNHVIFTGARSDIPEMLSVMDVYVNSSIREGIPVSLLEAMAAGKAVVATAVGGNTEVINDNAVGLIVPPNDSEALADRIMVLVKNEDTRNSLGACARIRIENEFSAANQAMQVEELYDDIFRRKCLAGK